MSGQVEPSSILHINPRATTQSRKPIFDEIAKGLACLSRINQRLRVGASPPAAQRRARAFVSNSNSARSRSCGSLSGSPVDPRFNLGGARADSVRFETEAPVDDLLIATSDGGYLAIQAKTSANLSRDPRSPFGKAIEQFRSPLAGLPRW